MKIFYIKGYSMCKLAVVGSRGFNDYEKLAFYINRFQLLNNFKITLIISGGAKGADSLAKQYAEEHEKEYKEYPAKWKEFGKKAGFLRNKDIVNNCDELMAFWDGKSKGTKHSIDLAKENKKNVIIIPVECTDEVL